MGDEAVEKMGNEAATAHGVENETADQIAKGEEFEKRGDEKTKRGLYAAAACFYRSAQSWNKAGAAYVKMARLPFQHQDPDAIPRNLVAAADCYMITSPEEALICLHEAVPLLPQNKTNCTITSRAGRIFQELGELRELEQNFEEAVECFELSYKLYECCGGFNMRGKGCRMKVAKLSALLGQYSMASEMFEEIVKQSVNGVIHNYNDVQMLLNACLCQLCLGGVFALTNSLQRYKELLRNFSCSNEYQFLEDLAVSFVEKDIRMFINDHVVWNVNALPWLITKKEQEFVFSDITEHPIPSLLWGYSAPIRLDSNVTNSDLFFLLAHDSDEFNRWEAGQLLSRKLMLSLIADFQQSKPLVLNQKFMDGLRSILLDSSLDKEFIAKAITLPGEREIMDAEFNRWEAGQLLSRKLMLSLVADFQQSKPLVLNQKFIEGSEAYFWTPAWIKNSLLRQLLY